MHQLSQEHNHSQSEKGHKEPVRILSKPVNFVKRGKMIVHEAVTLVFPFDCLREWGRVFVTNQGYAKLSISQINFNTQQEMLDAVIHTLNTLSY